MLFIPHIRAVTSTDFFYSGWSYQYGYFSLLEYIFCIGSWKGFFSCTRVFQLLVHPSLPLRRCWTGKCGPRQDQHLSGHSDWPEVHESVYICSHRLSHVWLFVTGLSFFKFYLTNSWEPNTFYPLWIRMDLEVKTMKEYSTFPKELGPYHQM